MIDVREDDSNAVKHAAIELELIGEEEDTINGYLRMIRVFTEMGHSGGSASVFIPTLTRLLEWKNLSPLTNDPKEWNEVGAGLWQNSRNSECFSKDGGATYYVLSELPEGYTKTNNPSYTHTSVDAKMPKPEWDTVGEMVTEIYSAVADEEKATQEEPMRDESDSSYPNLRSLILGAASHIINHDRQETYGSPRESFDRIAALWNGMGLRMKTGAESTFDTVNSADVALAMALLKVSRIISSPEHQDSWIDAAGYIALGAEMEMG